MSCCNRATEFGTIDKVEHEEDASLEEVVVTGSYLYTGAGVGLFTSHGRTRPWSRRPRIT